MGNRLGVDGVGGGRRYKRVAQDVLVMQLFSIFFCSGGHTNLHT